MTVYLEPMVRGVTGFVRFGVGYLFSATWHLSCAIHSSDAVQFCVVEVARVLNTQSQRRANRGGAVVFYRGATRFIRPRRVFVAESNSLALPNSVQLKEAGGHLFSSHDCAALLDPII
jgi:uncharacterized protein (UPF0179 family)